jgi:23S rRNA pseudouridine955/2504/2580 synthase
MSSILSKTSLKEVILFEDADFLVVNKPPFLSTLEDRTSKDNLLKLIRTAYPEATVGHRLDKDTSGVLVIAKHVEAYKWIAAQFEIRKVVKTYHAIVDGRHDYQQRTVDAPIEKLTDGTVRISRSNGKPSLTVFQTLKIFQKHTWVEAKPVTGRMHQIRIHLKLLKSPITGDLIYGGVPILLSAIKRRFKISKSAEEEAFMKRFALHAASIQFMGLDAKIIDVEAPYPKDFKALLNQLEKHKK